MLTIAAGLFVLGFFLMVNANLQRIVGRWTDAAELAVYLRDDATPEQTAAINDMLTKSGLADVGAVLSKDDARQEFARDFPDLAPAAADARAQSVSGVVRGPPERQSAGRAGAHREPGRDARRDGRRRRRPLRPDLDRAAERGGPRRSAASGCHHRAAGHRERA